jgi:hypothetical protein
MSATSHVITFLASGGAGLFVGAIGSYIATAEPSAAKLQAEYERGFAEAITSEPEPEKNTAGQLYTMADIRKAEKRAHRQGYEEAEKSFHDARDAE